MPIDIMTTSLATMGAPNLFEDFMFQLGDDGVILNAEPYIGAFVDITRVIGLDSAPVRASVRSLEGMDGGYVDARWEEARTVILNGTVYGDEMSVEAFLDALKGNYSPTKNDQPFYFRLPNQGVRTIFAKPAQFKYDLASMRSQGQVEIQITLIAGDSTIHGPATTTLIILEDSSASYGRGYDKTYNYGYGTTSASTPTGSVINNGNRPASAELVIKGPVTDPTIYHEESDTLMRFSIVLDVGDYLTIDLRKRSVRLNDSANRRGSLLGARPWFMLQPGQNTIDFGGTQHIAGPPNAALEIRTRAAYR